LVDAAAEEGLIAAARRGDRGAFGILVERYRDRLHRAAVGLTRGSADAEDLAQEAFIRAFGALGRFRGESAFSTWLFGVLLNVYRRWVRRRARMRQRVTNVQTNAPDLAPLPNRQAAAKDELEQALSVVDGLPPKLRQALVLRHIEEMSYREMARAIGCRVGTVRSRLHRARELLAARWRRARDE
jgi:RNA polymerase sigma-70 factor (ECF subfamily)